MMLEPDFNAKASECRVWDLRRRLLRLFVVAWLALLVSSALGFHFHSRDTYTCAVCRAGKVNHQLLGINCSSCEEETACSRWYGDHVEPSHAHVWITRGHCRRFGIPGFYGGYSCTVGGPLTGLSTTVQIEIYKHFKDPLDAKRLFCRLAQTNADSERLWAPLMSWVDKNYPGTWDDWLRQQPVTAQ
jgi:hypothetical protein